MGYIVHLITDELFNIHIREKFVIRMEEDGVYNEDPEFFKRIISDIENIDHIVINRYPYKKNIKQLLNDVWDYEIKDYISSDEINRSKKWIIDTYLSGKATDSKALYYDYESAYNFVLFASGNIVNRLTNNIDYKIIL
ncbi:hypothetical protein SDC9_170846 [bioreactor metagenome]|uniref:Phospholipase C/D domain-containing protein n=1 Tax=bioreactor metagenome TaxID=1076179 RepID=A0A645G982_9ZZZZ